MLAKMHLEGVRALDEHIKKLGHLYFCKKCVRSFNSDDLMDKCKFCGSDVTELNGHNNGKKQLYRVFCPICSKSTVTSDSIKRCPKCENTFLHSYPVNKMWKREFLRMRKRQICGNIIKALRNPLVKNK